MIITLCMHQCPGLPGGRFFVRDAHAVVYYSFALCTLIMGNKDRYDGKFRKRRSY